MIRLSRRTALRGAGTALALPWLEAMTPLGRRAYAAPPKRFVVFFSACGTIPDAWLPTGGENDFTLGRILAPLERHKKDLVVLDGVDNAIANVDEDPGDGHMKGMGCMLTGAPLLSGKTQGGSHAPAGLASGISVDQEIVARLRPRTRFPSLELGVQAGVFGAGTVWAYSNYRGPGQPLPADNSPRSVFNRIFLDLAVAGGDNSGVERLRAERQAVLDGIMGDYKRLGARVGSEDRRKIEAHLGAVDELEKRLLLPRPPVTARGCVRPKPPLALDPMANDNFPAVGRLQTDLLVMALACDLTRVATLQWSNSVSSTRFTWLGAKRGHHDMSHDADSNLETKEMLTLINIWYAEQLAYLIDRMKQIPEGDGTLFDNTVILWCNELAKGNIHSHPNMPYVLAGRAGGRLKTGRFLRYAGAVSDNKGLREKPSDAIPHNNLLVSILNAFDIPATRFGSPAFCTGPLAGLV